MTPLLRIPRDYQFAAVVRTIDALIMNPILVAPTGSGKSFMGSMIVKELQRRTVWMTHRRELVKQAADHLLEYFPTVGIVAAGYPRTDALVQVASIDSLRNREIEEPELIVVDECAHSAAKSWAEILNRFPCPRIGLTATPFRLDGRGLRGLFGEIVVAARPKDLCDRGILHAPRVWSHPPPDLSGIRKVGGDYSLSGLAGVMRKLVGHIVPHWFKHAADRRTVVFAVDIEHSREIAASFRTAGITAEHVDGGTPLEERDAILSRLRDGTTKIVSNCMVLTEGWDLPALECAIIARPTKSLALHLQMIGRIMRTSPGKTGAIVLDHAGNHDEHGRITKHIEYTLDGVDKKKTQRSDCKMCPQCFMQVDAYAHECPNCQFIFMREPKEIPWEDGELVELNENDPAYRIGRYAELAEQAAASGYRAGWAGFRYKDLFGTWPTQCVIMGVVPEKASLEQKESVYRHYLTVARSKGHADGAASHRFKDEFGSWPSGFVTRVKSEVPHRPPPPPPPQRPTPSAQSSPP